MDENYVLWLKCLVFIAILLSSTYFLNKLFDYLWRKRNGKHDR